MDATEYRHEPLRWHVRIDGWQPTTLNRLTNCHWATRNRLKKHDANIIAVSCLGADVPKADHPRRVSLEIVLGPRQRGADPDAYWKTVLDALVKCGALKDDSATWCEPGGVTYRRGERPGCVIVLENILEARNVSRQLYTAAEKIQKTRPRRVLGVRLRTV